MNMVRFEGDASVQAPTGSSRKWGLYQILFQFRGGVDNTVQMIMS